jgi:hypothetical protein
MNVLCQILINDNLYNIGSSMPPICKLQMIKHVLEFVKNKKKRLKKKVRTHNCHLRFYMDNMA